jgi:hypothetical protein
MGIGQPGFAVLKKEIIVLGQHFREIWLAT